MFRFLSVSFTWLPGWIQTCGATEAGTQADYPGDGVLKATVVEKAHAFRIAAPQTWFAPGLPG